MSTYFAYYPALSISKGHAAQSKDIDMKGKRAEKLNKFHHDYKSGSQFHGVIFPFLFLVVLSDFFSGWVIVSKY